ncbi:hypothetical protein ONZ51_g3947 [Trametes cubensis]|uniref:NADP-dependent oxidoreductase domain-containing protein n=1 Tax=Trametes cubensis TaxID=1111947 RepID=A0AAD7XD04_9APHY|nr:hypothetical protein ONZ51_g3947 [Trametes cubensis]
MDAGFAAGTSIPSVAFGTWTLGGGAQATDYVEQAISVGFSHIDTAQSYRNEEEAGKAIRESGLAREDLYITTKFSGRDGLDIETSIKNSLKFLRFRANGFCTVLLQLGVDYVDLYLIHHPRLATPDIPTAWAKMEKLKQDGLVKSASPTPFIRFEDSPLTFCSARRRSIGVSNFGVPELQILLASAKVKPAANQILLHPYVHARQSPIIEFGNAHGIVSEAYSVLIPLTHQPGGPVDKPVNDIASRLQVKPEQVLLAWAKSKGVVVVTSSTKEERLKGYLAAGDLALTADDVAAIDAAGAKGARRQKVRAFVSRVAVVALAAAVGFGVCGYLGIDLI